MIIDMHVKGKKVVTVRTPKCGVEISLRLRFGKTFCVEDEEM